jgi:acetyl-CoA carboxylase carboxyl transferase subunit beta
VSFIAEELRPADPLDFFDLRPYPERLSEAQLETGLTEAMVAVVCRIEGRPAALGVMDFRFFVASMGSAVGEKVTRLTELATAQKLPLIIFCASGGARMQEGMLSLAQMAKTASAVARHSDAGGLYISVLTDPTTAGVAASFASLGDVVLGEPKALIGFAGPRVIKLTHRIELPEGFQTAEFLLEHGLLDAVVPRIELRNYLTRTIDLLSPLAKQPQPVPAEARANS